MKLWQIGVSAGSLLLISGIIAALIRKRAGNAGEGQDAEENNAKDEFASYAAAFSGLYEPLYKIAKGIGKFKAGVVGDWAVRTENLTNAQSYIEYWQSEYGDFSAWTAEEGRQKAEKLLSFVQDAGVRRSEETELTVGGGAYKKYNYAEEMIEEGSAASVKTPYWYCGDTVLEKGIIQRKEG